MCLRHVLNTITSHNHCSPSFRFCVWKQALFYHRKRLSIQFSHLKESCDYLCVRFRLFTLSIDCRDRDTLLPNLHGSQPANSEIEECDATTGGLVNQRPSSLIFILSSTRFCQSVDTLHPWYNTLSRSSAIIPDPGHGHRPPRCWKVLSPTYSTASWACMSKTLTRNSSM